MENEQGHFVQLKRAEHASSRLGQHGAELSEDDDLKRKVIIDKPIPPILSTTRVTR